MATGLWQVLTISSSEQTFGPRHVSDEDPESPAYIHSIRSTYVHALSLAGIYDIQFNFSTVHNVCTYVCTFKQ